MEKTNTSRFLNDISFNGKKKIKPSTISLATKLVKFSERNNILFTDSDEHLFLQLPKADVVVYLVDLLSIFQSTVKNNQTQDVNNTATTLLPETIDIIEFMRKHKFSASRGLITNKEVYGRLMYPKTKCDVYYKHQGCNGNHHEEFMNKDQYSFY